MGTAWFVLTVFTVGAIARLIAPDGRPRGFFGISALGIIGTLFATYGSQAFGSYAVDEWQRFVGAIVFSMVVLVVYDLFIKKSS
jgi:uncharacterized membrane protein YeaQ/YmgE (transglycosylase-associated protein family)